MTSAENDESRLIGRNLSSNKGYVIPILFKDILRRKKRSVSYKFGQQTFGKPFPPKFLPHTQTKLITRFMPQYLLPVYRDLCNIINYLTGQITKKKNILPFYRR